MSKLTIDKECRELVRAMNLCRGVSTFYSCCGHGEKVFVIKFKVGTLSDLLPVVLASGGHLGNPVWACFVENDTHKEKDIVFTLTSPSDVKGADAYDQASQIAKNIYSLLSNDEIRTRLGLDWADRGKQLELDFD